MSIHVKIQTETFLDYMKEVTSACALFVVPALLPVAHWALCQWRNTYILVWKRYRAEKQQAVCSIRRVLQYCQLPTPHQLLLRLSNQGGQNWHTCGTYGEEGDCLHVLCFGGETWMKRDSVEELDTDSILKRILKTQDETWNGSIWLRIGTNNRHFWIQ